MLNVFTAVYLLPLKAKSKVKNVYVQNFLFGQHDWLMLLIH